MHFFIVIYLFIFRSSLIAAEQALKLEPDYKKTIMRAINCCTQLKEFDKCLDYCDKYLERVPEDNSVMEIKKEALKLKVILIIICAYVYYNRKCVYIVF